MGKILYSATVLSGVNSNFVNLDKGLEQHSVFGLKLDGDFDSGTCVVICGKASNRRMPAILNPETGLSSLLSFTVNGFYYFEALTDHIRFLIENDLGSASVEFILYSGKRI